MKTNEQVQTAFAAFTLPRYGEIPDVGLYLEQVVRLINGYLTDFPEMSVTPSMIANYVKLKLIPRVNKKAYSRDQIATLIFIALAKTVLSINHIRTITSGEEDHGETYTWFTEKLVESLHSFNAGDVIFESTSSLSEKNQLLANIVIAVCQHMYLERRFEEEETDKEESS